jgi:hypothetical protein
VSISSVIDFNTNNVSCPFHKLPCYETTTDDELQGPWMDLFSAVLIFQRGLDGIQSHATVSFQLNKQLHASPVLALPKIVAVLQPMTKRALLLDSELVLYLICSKGKFARPMLLKFQLVQMRVVAVA